ncbi:MAG TPA: DUF1318 domain-containing protein [Sedimenticola sp.]|nr:DUF1318 domain-containing protein [Sedimenticola sp.]
MTHTRLPGALAALLLLAACVTINIYFPAAQAEQAADRIVDDILGKKPALDSRPKEGALRPTGESRLGQGLLDFLIPVARAGSPDFTVDTPRIRQLQAAMKQRFQRLRPFYDRGAIGFTRDALVKVRDAGAIALKDKNRLHKLLAAENRDRNALYRAIAEANGHPEWEPQVRAVFARTWIQKADRGWWYQDAGGGWKRK